MSQPTYQRTILFQSDYFEVVRCEWKKGDCSPMHGHEWSQCYALVEKGVFENTTNFGSRLELSLREEGQTILTPVGAEHEIRCVSDHGKTLHVYVPKIAPIDKRNPKAFALKANLSDLVKLEKEGLKWEGLLTIVKAVESSSITTKSPFFMNQLFSGIHPESLLASEIVARTRTTLATQEASPLFSQIEKEVANELGFLFGWPKTKADGICVPGGSAGNFMALHCARNRKFPTAKTEGTGSRSLRVFVSEEAHYSFKKGAMALGLGTNSLVAVKADKNGKMIPENLEEKIQECLSAGAFPLLVSATAGTTVLGAFDPMEAIGKICRKHNIWFHIDAAWGGPVIFSQHKLMQGSELADSITFDAHKLLGSGLTCSFFLTNDLPNLLASNDVSGGDYLFHESEELDRGRLSWQCGRGADAFSFWTFWKSYGTEGIGKFVDQLMELRKETVKWIKQNPRLKLLGEPEYLNICVEILPLPSANDDKDWSVKVRNQLIASNEAMVNFSRDKEGRSFLRLILANPHLRLSHLQDILGKALEVS